MTATTALNSQVLAMYKIADAVVMLRMSRSAIYEEIKAGRLCTVKRGRATFITADDMADYIKLLKREADDAR